jgi:hypothetical protein
MAIRFALWVAHDRSVVHWSGGRPAHLVVARAIVIDFAESAEHPARGWTSACETLTLAKAFAVATVDRLVSIAR